MVDTDTSRHAHGIENQHEVPGDRYPRSSDTWSLRRGGDRRRVRIARSSASYGVRSNRRTRSVTSCCRCQRFCQILNVSGEMTPAASDAAPHETSLAVWDIPSPLPLGGSAKMKG